MQQTINDNVILYPPNKSFARHLDYSEVPIMHKSLLYIDFNQRGEAILGSSCVNGTVWQSTTFWFSNPQDLEDLNWSAYYIGPTSSDAKFLNDRTVALAEDNGDLQIVNISEKRNIESYLYFRHFSKINQIAVWNNSSKVLTCSDKILMIFDADASKKISEHYPHYHCEQIYGVDTLKYQENYFVSCGADRRALIWDKRLDNVASVLYSNEFAALTSIAWNQNDENFIVCGTEGGDIYLLDRREPKSFVDVIHCFNYNIHKISFNSNSNQLAVCGDTDKIHIFDSTNNTLKNVHISNEHSDIVRGLSWNQNDLYSSGFDKKICKHKL